MKRKRILMIFVVVVSLAGVWAQNSYGKSSEDFSFIVFGDNRLPGYFPYTSEEKPDIKQFFEDVAEYVVGPGAKFKLDVGFNPETDKVAWIKVWPEDHPEQYTIYAIENGWPQLMVRGIPPRVALRSEGQAWVYDSILGELARGVKTQDGPIFCLNTGDITYNGYEGKTRDKSPYWDDFYKRFVKKLPQGVPEGLPARFFPSPGNHETWADKDVEGFTESFPYLSKLGFTRDRRQYMFDHKGCRFIFLDTGSMDYHDPADWGGKHPDFQKQMITLTEWLKDAEKKNIDHVFITYHNPSFCRSGFGPLPEDHNPHLYLKPFSQKLDITVFNGHVHTTEAYKVDGIRYFVLGAGGGEQGYMVNKMPEDYPVDLYWRGNPHVEDYNFMIVNLSDKGLRFIIKRFRPGDKLPYSEKTLFE